MKLQTDNERNMMSAEETVSRYGAMKRTVEDALHEKALNQDKLDKFDQTVAHVHTLEGQRKQLFKEIESLKDKVARLEN